MRFVLLFLIRIYQKTLSLDHGILKSRHPNGFCRFYPTCSEYCAQAIKKFGILKGLFLSFKRLFRCNPWNQGGYDPI